MKDNLAQTINETARSCNFMKPNLESVNAKLLWAKQHADTFRKECRTWMESNPYNAVQQCNSDFTHYSLVANLIGNEPPLQRWSLIVGDSLHGLRCSLDHLVYTIAIVESGKNPPPDEDKLAFPIASTKTEFTKVEGRRLSGISSQVKASIESMQPYNRGHSKLPPPLAILRDLNNTDKHKLLRLAYATPLQGDIGFAGPTPSAKKVNVAANYGEIKDGAEIVSHTFDSPAPGMKYDRIDLELSVALWHGKRSPSDPDWSARNDCSALLTLITKEVEFIIETVVSAV
jgi:hypothetical protein